MSFLRVSAQSVQEGVLERRHRSQHFQIHVWRRSLQAVDGLAIIEEQFGIGRDRLRQVQEVLVRPQKLQRELQDNPSEISSKGRRSGGGESRIKEFLLFLRRKYRKALLSWSFLVFHCLISRSPALSTRINRWRNVRGASRHPWYRTTSGSARTSTVAATFIARNAAASLTTLVNSGINAIMPSFSTYDPGEYWTKNILSVEYIMKKKIYKGVRFFSFIFQLFL